MSLVYFGIFLRIFMNFMSCAVHMATERVARAPDWCSAATGTGTYSSRVAMPRHTCNRVFYLEMTINCNSSPVKFPTLYTLTMPSIRNCVPQCENKKMCIALFSW